MLWSRIVMATLYWGYMLGVEIILHFEPSELYIDCIIIHIHMYFPTHTDAAYNPHHLCMVTYRMPVNFIPKIKSHGNSKTGQPFFPTWPSTKTLIKCEGGSSGPKETVAKVSAMVGGISKASCSCQLPRNERQVMYFQNKCTSNPADELYEVMFAAKQEEKGSKYIRAIKVIPELALILATDSQICDLNRFCTDSETFCVMTVDPTFSLGDFDVTPITCHNLLFHSRCTGNPPVCIGPVMIHYRKTYETYLFFASSLVGMSRGLIDLKAFGTDGEFALSDAFSHEFSCTTT